MYIYMQGKLWSCIIKPTRINNEIENEKFVAKIITKNIKDNFNLDDCLKEVDEKMYLFKRKKRKN